MDALVTIIGVLFCFFFILPLILRIPIIGTLLKIGAALLGFWALFNFALSCLTSGNGIMVFIGAVFMFIIFTPLLYILFFVVPERRVERKREEKITEIEAEIKELTEYHKKKATELKAKNKND